jgi:hypothetical protein
MHERVIRECWKGSGNGLFSVVRRLLYGTTFSIQDHNNLFSSLCVCVFLLWPCTLRLWAVTMRQLKISCLTTLPPIQKPTIRALLPNAVLNQGSKRNTHLCKAVASRGRPSSLLARVSCIELEAGVAL